MKLRYLLPIIGTLFLQACPHNDEQEEPAVNSSKLTDAASYNTQLGLAYLKQGDRSRAKRKLLLAMKQSPNSADVNASMAYFLEKSGEMDEAQIYYQKAMAVAPGSGAQLNNYGAFLCRRGQYTKAEDYFMKAVKDIQYDHTAGAYENAGLCAMAIPDYPKATHYFEKALQQDPARRQSLYDLATIELKQGHLNEALSFLQKYPDILLKDPMLLALAAEVAHKAEKYELEADYKMRLNRFSANFGGKNDNNNHNG